MDNKYKELGRWTGISATVNISNNYSGDEGRVADSVEEMTSTVRNKEIKIEGEGRVWGTHIKK